MLQDGEDIMRASSPMKIARPLCFTGRIKRAFRACDPHPRSSGDTSASAWRTVDHFVQLCRPVLSLSPEPRPPPPKRRLHLLHHSRILKERDDVNRAGALPPVALLWEAPFVEEAEGAEGEGGHRGDRVLLFLPGRSRVRHTTECRAQDTALVESEGRDAKRARGTAAVKKKSSPDRSSMKSAPAASAALGKRVSRPGTNSTLRACDAREVGMP